jgi:hypothetical protein
MDRNIDNHVVGGGFDREGRLSIITAGIAKRA